MEKSMQTIEIVLPEDARVVLRQDTQRKGEFVRLTSDEWCRLLSFPMLRSTTTERPSQEN